MNQLIEIKEQNGQQLVSARNLYDFLEVTERFQQWFDKKVERYEFVENKDFIGCKIFHTLAKQEIQDYLLTLPAAKEISMVQNNEKGKQARTYFIKCEEAWNSEEMILARALDIQNRKVLAYKEQVEQLETKIIEMRPKEIFADAVSASNDCILIGDLAKLLKQNGIETGQNRLFTLLREKGFLISRMGDSYNMPTQKSMDLKLLEIKETTITNGEKTRITKTTKVTGKGQQYFINLFLGERITQ